MVSNYAHSKIEITLIRKKNEILRTTLIISKYKYITLSLLYISFYLPPLYKCLRDNHSKKCRPQIEMLMSGMIFTDLK